MQKQKVSHLLVIAISIGYFFILTSELSARTNAIDNNEVEKWHGHSWIGRGHEDLTRWGVSQANQILKEKNERVIVYPEVIYGEDGVSSANPMIQGNFRTDFADGPMLERYRDFHSNDSWGENNQLQMIHFLRNYDGRGVSSIVETCSLARKMMIENTLLAFKFYKKQEGGEASPEVDPQFFYWLGHVQHTIQDSFSPAHTVREGEGHREVKAICTYGKEFPNICYHDTISLSDRIWSWSPRCLFGGRREMDCLKPQAQAAIEASTGYLLVINDLVAKFLSSPDESSWKNMVEESMVKYFENVDSPYTGFFDCADPDSLL